LLGAKLDKKVTNEQAMFLPDYLLKGFDSALVNGHSLVNAPQFILQMPAPPETNSLFSPGIVFSILFIVVVILSLYKRKWTRTAVGIFDFLLFFIVGSAGLLILFMWFGTDHKVCQDNFNLLWALPTHTVMAFFVHRNTVWVKNYFKAVGWLSLLLVIILFQLIPQHINNALLPVILLVGFRSLMIAKHERRNVKREKRQNK
jgi:peptidoglycan/LPS O-acetylase OafA/YrhL